MGRSWCLVSRGCHGGDISAAVMTLGGPDHPFVWQSLSILPGTSRFSKTAGESMIAQMSSGAFWERTRNPVHPNDSWRIISELAVSVEKKQNQFLGTTKQWESFQRYPTVAQLQDPSRLVLWKALDVNSKPFEKCHFEFMKISGEENIESGNCSGWKWHFQEWLIWIYSHAKWSRVPTVYTAKCLHVLLVECIFR